MGKANYEEILADLEAKKAKIDAAIEVIKELRGEAPSGAGPQNGKPAPAAEATEVRDDTFFSLSVPDAIKKCLGIMKRPQVTTEICESLRRGGHTSGGKKTFYATVSTALHRLKKSGEVVYIPSTRGWGLASWYDSAPKNRPDSRTAKKDQPTDAEKMEPDNPGQQATHSG